MTRIGLLGVMLLLAALVASAQAPAVAPEPQDTREQSLQLQLFDSNGQTLELQAVLIEQAKRQLAREREAYIVQLEKEHPGWLKNRQTLKWEKAPAKK